jgi:hypothetical protein
MGSLHARSSGRLSTVIKSLRIIDIHRSKPLEATRVPRARSGRFCRHDTGDVGIAALHGAPCEILGAQLRCGVLGAAGADLQQQLVTAGLPRRPAAQWNPH